MPFYRTCTACPKDDQGRRPTFADLTDAMDHARIEHPKVEIGYVIETKFETQAEAQGNRTRRMGNCSVCGGRWETTDANPSGRCADCDKELAGAH